MRSVWRIGAPCLAISVAPSLVQACATCGCTLSADAAAGYSAIPGWRVNLEYDYIDQEDLRHGTGGASPADVVNRPSDPDGGGEIERDTLNRYLTLGVSYSPSASWNIDLLLPYVARTHSTFGVQPPPYSAEETAPGQISRARFNDLGDLRLIGTWQGLLPTHNLGLQLGVKLPTGRFGTDVRFRVGPAAAAPLDASLQPGTGSTDLIVGAFYYQAISQNFDAFANAQFQAAVSSRQTDPDDDFRPGNSLAGSIGLRYEAHPMWVPQLQLNLLHRAADQGALADRPDTAGTVAYVSPGITLHAGGAAHVYLFMQLPVYSNLSGYQLLPRWTATAGVNYAF